jgi:hypothetical protein
MRHIPLDELLAKIFSTRDGEQDCKRLLKAENTVLGLPLGRRADYIDRNGSRKWTPMKRHLTSHCGSKCWYTEAEVSGAPLGIDHYRPKESYPWLAFDVENYRVACPFANSGYGPGTGKGRVFPLLAPGKMATSKSDLQDERPLILDPCNRKDCQLVAFQSDGRPVLNPVFAGDAEAVRRLDESKILLNLDHPQFNSKREQLYHEIAGDVQAHEQLPATAPARNMIRARLEQRITPKAAFSVAATFYLGMHRHLAWVEALLKANQPPGKGP